MGATGIFTSAEAGTDVLGEICLKQRESVHASHWAEPSGTLDGSLLVMAYSLQHAMDR
ncbi:hypothetical protein Psta_1245 [Pirellula staleyi DSM 6068]|uniref:Uncharacterized protein n=1 Tax=Pirellula staleyi (strain ATCC 27377 / DSM 6068 / ICPB 4128) TaxID=530564 RepID=D2QW48_PIRSD|nr:hypothetical protein Psta_1245 [Pirellula staleyi DSM 6068]